MAIERRLTGYSGIRVDLPHLRSIESAVSKDFDNVLRNLVTGLDKPYIMKGFEIKIPDAAINANSLQIAASGSAVLHTTSAQSGTIFVVEAATPDDSLNSSNPKVIGSFQNNAANYVSVELVRVSDPNSADQTAGWSESQKTQFNRTVPIAAILEYRYIISTSGFSTNLPLYIVGVSSTGAVQYITNARTSLFRLGTGGSVPNPFFSFQFGGFSNAQDPSNPRREWINEAPTVNPNPVTAVPGDDPLAFHYGDWSITSLKDWMDAVMTRFKEITNSTYWYTTSLAGGPSSGPNIFDVWYDSVGSVMTGSGYINYNLILEIGAIQDGYLQSQQNDNTVLPGDVYVQGLTSGNTATLQSFNNTQLVINSLARDNFIPDETLLVRRVWRPNLAQFILDDVVSGSDRMAVMSRKSTVTNPSVQILSWSYIGNLITVNTAAAHGLSVGNAVLIEDLETSLNEYLPNGVFMVKEVPSSTSLVYSAPLPPTGVAQVTIVSQLSLDGAPTQPYLPNFDIVSWSYVGNQITVVPKNSTVETGDDIVVAGLVSLTNAPNGRYTGVTVNPDNSITFTAAATPTGTPTLASVAKVYQDSYQFLMTVTGASPDGYNVNDVVAETFDGYNFYYVLGPSTIPALAPATGAISVDGVSATSTVANPALVDRIDNDGAGSLTVTTSEPHGFNTIPGPVDFTIYGDSSISQYIRTYTDVSILQVQKAVTSIEQFVGYLEVVIPNHGFYSGNQAAISGAGNPLWDGTREIISIVDANTFWTDAVGLVGTSPLAAGGNINNLNQFIIDPIPPNGTVVLPPPSSYINSGSDQTFARYPNNPFAGPVQWTSDLIIKGIIGDKQFVIEQTATASGTPLANQFNVDGITGTVYLQDKEVAYINLDRNNQVSDGVTYTAISSSQMTGAVPPVDKDGNPLRAGDFVKFGNEPESRWIRIAGVRGTPIVTNTFNLESDNGQAPNPIQRPVGSGALVYFKGSYNEVFVAPHYLVPSSTDVYWLAVRRDNGSARSKVYLKALELEAGESRQISDNEPSNLLIYTGAMNEAAINPNYTFIDAIGPYQASEILTVGSNTGDVNTETRSITFDEAPELGFSAGDRLTFLLMGVPKTYSIDFLLSSLTVVVNEDVSDITLGQNMTYLRDNYSVNNNDNLTLAIRKQDREQAKVNTALERPIYDESIYPQQMNLSGAGTIRSGSYIYQGPQNAPTAQAWVLNGTVNVNEMIEGTTRTMPGGTFGASAILVHVYSGSWLNGSAIFQNGANTGFTVNNPGDPEFDSPALPGGPGGMTIVLPPNRRTSVQAGVITRFPSHSVYKASLEDVYAGEELMVINNDTIRQANLDYEETFGGPKAQITIRRDAPPKSRLRFRILPSYGSALIKLSGNVTLQLAYDGGRIISSLAGLPVEIRAADASTGGTALRLRGSMEVNGLGASPGEVTGGIFGPLSPNADKAFLIGKENNKPKETWTAEHSVKSHDNYTGSAWKFKTGAGVSSGNTATTINNASVTINTNQVVRVTMSLVGKRTDGPEGGATFRIEGMFYYDTMLGQVVAAGTLQTFVTGAYGDGIEYAVSFGVIDVDALNGLNDIVPVVFGTDGSTIQWVVSVEYQILEDSV